MPPAPTTPGPATIGKSEGDRVGLILLRNDLGSGKLANLGRGMGMRYASFGAFVFNGLERFKPPQGITTRFAVFLASARA